MNVLETIYKALSILLCNPAFSKSDLDGIEKLALSIDDSDLDSKLKKIYCELREILTKKESVLAEGDYISLFELSPKAPLYLSHYISHDPQHKISFMLYLKNLYRSYGLIQIDGELPDYLPIILEFLGLSIDKYTGKSRASLILRYVLPSVTRIKQIITPTQSPYVRIIDLVIETLKYDVSIPQKVIGSA